MSKLSITVFISSIFLWFYYPTVFESLRSQLVSHTDALQLAFLVFSLAAQVGLS